MTTLIVTAHPDPRSLTHSLAATLKAALQPAVVEVADLAAEKFDPCFTIGDRDTYSTGLSASADIEAEQQRLDRAANLILVFPVYWWSLPALMKGWIDRVFVNGWAFDAGDDGIKRRLSYLTIHLVAIAGDSASLYERHGYHRAFLTQVQHGIIDFCGAKRGAVAFIYDSESNAGARNTAIAAAVNSVRTSMADTSSQPEG